MHWKVKAYIQNALSRLPDSASYEAYYRIQRHFGSLRRIDPLRRLAAATDTWTRIQNQGHTPSGKVFLEVGTGRVPLVPMAFWLMGAEKTITIDRTRYLKAELVLESLQYMDENAEEITSYFGSLLDAERFERLMSFGRDRRISVDELLELCHIVYVAPGDAADTTLPNHSIDFYTSFMVLEHIPREALKKILEEGNRIINNGLFVHRIDYSDHFAHSDKNISAINFLQYSDRDWERQAGNRYMYTNRLRHDDFVTLFKSVGHSVLEEEPGIDARSLELLRSGRLRLDERFATKTYEVLATTGAWFVTRHCGGQSGQNAG